MDVRRRLQVHHLQHSSWGGTDDTENLVSVCAYRHGLLVPHGDCVLEGNPDTPDGLTLHIVTREERERRRVEPMTLRSAMTPTGLQPEAVSDR